MSAGRAQKLKAKTALLAADFDADGQGHTSQAS